MKAPGHACPSSSPPLKRRTSFASVVFVSFVFFVVPLFLTLSRLPICHSRNPVDDRCEFRDIDPGRLPLALRGVLDGEAALPRQLVALLIEEFRERRRRRRIPLRGRRSAELTDREWEVLQLMRQGAHTEEIAARLFISPVTVRTHVSAILRKLQVPTREAAIELLER